MITTTPPPSESADDLPALHPASEVPGGEHFEVIVQASIGGSALSDDDIHTHFTTDGSTAAVEQVRATIASAQDGPALARLELTSPIQMGEVAGVYDRGEGDYSAGDRRLARSRTAAPSRGRSTSTSCSSRRDRDE